MNSKMSILTVDALVRLAVCAIGVALLVRTLSLVWTNVLDMNVTPRQQALLSAAVIGFLAGFDFIRNYRLAATMSLIIVGGWFLTKWLMRGVDKVFPS